MNILDQLAEYSRLRVAEDKKKISLEEMKISRFRRKMKSFVILHLKKHSKRMA